MTGKLHLQTMCRERSYTTTVGADGSGQSFVLNLILFMMSRQFWIYHFALVEQALFNILYTKRKTAREKNDCIQVEIDKRFSNDIRLVFD